MLTGRQLGPYRIVAKLGEGGMGQVYRATDSRLDRDVAIKVLPQPVAGDPDRRARFEREARALASLNHPNVAQIHGAEDVDGAFAIVMELVEGEDLASRVARGPLRWAEVQPIARQIAAVLDAAHERGIVHRDLKPANIRITSDDTVKVLDFGLAKIVSATEPVTPDPALSPTFTASVTRQGTILGTAAYMAPEQAKGKPVDKRADIWAFGVILFELLTG
ncbi:MAG TPA: serine/threonine-protein kinase, partial [Vicinamibacterales bacterium]